MQCSHPFANVPFRADPHSDLFDAIAADNDTMF
jgi:hypothetical protein